MTFARAIFNVLASALLFALLGAGVGYVLGQFTPDYYRNIFRAGQQPQFDPVPTGIAMGLTQGAAAGAVIGLALVALLCWRDVRRERVEAGISTTVPRETSFRTLRVVGFLLLLVILAGIAFLLGAILGEQGAYHRQYEIERQALVPVLASDLAFAGIELRRRSNGGVSLDGKMPTTPDDKLRLRTAVIRAVGETRAKEILGGNYLDERH